MQGELHQQYHKFIHNISTENYADAHKQLQTFIDNKVERLFDTAYKKAEIKNKKTAPKTNT